jgi:hypothetical protein
MKRQHKWLLAVGLLVMLVAWLAWTLLSAESDLAPQGSLRQPQPALASAAVHVDTQPRTPSSVALRTAGSRA